MERILREQRLLGELRVIFSATRQHIAAVKRETGVSAALLWALDEVVRDPGVSPGDLAERLGVHATTASNLCSRLKQKGLIRSRPNPNDRRVAQLQATPTGRKLRDRAPQPRSGVISTAIHALDDQTLDAATLALAALRQQVAALGYSDDPMETMTGS